MDRAGICLPNAFSTIVRQSEHRGFETTFAYFETITVLITRKLDKQIIKQRENSGARIGSHSASE